MKVYRDLNDFTKLNYAVVTSGIFDGVHIGHQKILNKVKESAKNNKGESVVITFHPHPKKILQPNLPPPLALSTIEEKIELISNCGIDHLLIIPFTKEFSELSSLDFIMNVLVDQIGTKKLIIGYDHKFGKNREGSFEFLKQNESRFGFAVEEISREDIDQVGISSTIIRNALSSGNIKMAAENLGRPYSMIGTVIHGKKLGHTLGYPTANLKVDDNEKLIPMNGIYTVGVKVNGIKYGGMMSIGFNPTVDGTKKSMEVNIFDFDQNIYDKEIEVSFIEYLRKEEKFNSLEDLIQQLHKDKENSISILKKQKG